MRTRASAATHKGQAVRVTVPESETEAPMSQPAARQTQPTDTIGRVYARGEWTLQCGCHVISGKETDEQAVCRDEVVVRYCPIHAEAPAMAEALRKLANLDTEGVCRSCACGIAPEGYCGCAPTPGDTVAYRDRCDARAILARIDRPREDRS